MLDMDHKQIIKRLAMHFAVEYLFFNRSKNRVLNGAIEDLSIIVKSRGMREWINATKMIRSGLSNQSGPVKEP